MMAETEINLQQEPVLVPEGFEIKIRQLEAKATDFETIDTADGYVAAADFVLNRAMGERDALVEFFKPHKVEAWRKHRSICAQEERWTVRITKLIDTIKAKCKAWSEARRREWQAAVDAVEAEARLDMVRRTQEEALRLADAGDEEAAMRLLAQPIVPVIISPGGLIGEPPRVPGARSAKTYRAIADPDLTAEESLWRLVQWVAKDRARLNFVEARLPELNKRATQMRETFDVPGYKLKIETDDLRRSKK